MAFPLLQSSRFIYTPLVTFQDKETYSKWVPTDVFKTRPAEQFITKYKVPQNQGGRPDLIAYTLYNDVNLDWVIIAFNNPRDVLGWPKPLEVIEIPDISLVLGELS